MLPAFALAPLALATVLVVSGLAKLPDPRSTHRMLTELRLPGTAAHRALARLLPWAELTVAGLLLTPWRWTFALGALAAVGLFLAFWVVVARAMSFDPRPACACFGRVGDHRITGRTVLRNSVLLALALLTATVALLGGTGTGTLADFGAGDWAWLLLAGAVTLVAALAVGPGDAQEAPGVATAPGDGRPAARGGRSLTPGTVSISGDDGVLEGVLVGPAHEAVPLRRLTAQQPQLLVLVDCWCGSTVATINQLAGWRERLPQLGVQLVHTHAPWDEPRLAHVPGVWWDPGARVYSGLGAGPGPVGVLVEDGRVVGEPVTGVEAVGRLVDRLDRQGRDRTGPSDAGLRAPDAP